ncbi:unnamed protein product [Urochloa decumbens]|uniref:Neprosin PEP catalytic domain-containing protein n=1 Tax=Urochloa decumbens TaxID=240449 RepID=A0ABC9HCS1_9POAL
MLVLAWLQVYPSVLGDNNPRLYIYATVSSTLDLRNKFNYLLPILFNVKDCIFLQNDGGEKSHCLNHECGFIQTNNQFALGTAFSNESRAGGDLYFIKVALYRQSPGPEVWWLSINDVPIGYFDSGMFAVPFIESFYNEMGGRVLNSRPGGKHTTTQMGNGMYPSAGLHGAASIAYYMALNNNGGDQVDNPINTIVTNPKCYDVKNYGMDLNHPGYDVAYGGPGGNECDQ